MDEARLFSVVHSDTTKSKGLKHERRKFHKNVWKNFFVVRVMGHWNRLPATLWSLLLQIYSRSVWTSPLQEVDWTQSFEVPSNPYDSVT